MYLPSTSYTLHVQPIWLNRQHSSSALVEEDVDDECSVDGGISICRHVTFCNLEQRRKPWPLIPTLYDLHRPYKMVQGKTKGLQVKASSTRHAQKAAANLKKGKKTIAPKKAPLIKQDQMKKVRDNCWDTGPGLD